MADESQKLLDVAWQQIIFAVDEVKAAFGKSLRQLEGQQTFFLQEVVRCLFRDNGNAHTAGNKVFDSFLIVDAGNNLQLAFGNTAVGKKVICHFFAAAALFAQNQRLAQKLRQNVFLALFILQEMLVDRRNDNHAVFAEGQAAEVAVLAAHADEAEVEEAVFKAVDDALTVALVNDKVNILMQFAEVRQKLRQNIGRGDGGGTEMDDAPTFDRAGLYHALLQLQNIQRVFVKLASLGRYLQTFGGTQNQLGVKLAFQLVNVRADGGLRYEKPACGLRKAFLLHYGDEALQLFKVHGRAPLSMPAGQH